MVPGYAQAMTARRIMGTEVEYGISVPSDPTANPILTSTQAVLAYAAAAGIQRRAGRGGTTRWSRRCATPAGSTCQPPTRHTPSIDADEVGAANMILTNGARLYVDHAHPEYSAPEVTDPLDAVIWDKAGERVMEAAATPRGHRARRAAAAALQEQRRRQGRVLRLARELPDDPPDAVPVDHRRPDAVLVSRQVVTGSGRVGIGPSGDEPGFQLSQRADYIEVEVGLETTLKRGIINTRDEPHADADKYRRLHVIIGDANLAETRPTSRSAPRRWCST